MVSWEELNVGLRNGARLEEHLELAEAYLAQLGEVRKGISHGDFSSLPQEAQFVTSGRFDKVAELLQGIDYLDISGRLRYQSRIGKLAERAAMAEQSVRDAYPLGCQRLRKLAGCYLSSTIDLSLVPALDILENEISSLLDDVEAAETFTQAGVVPQQVLTDYEYDDLEALEFCLGRLSRDFVKIRGLVSSECERLYSKLRRFDRAKANHGNNAPQFKAAVTIMSKAINRIEEYLGALESEDAPPQIRGLWTDFAERLLQDSTPLLRAYACLAAAGVDC